MKTRIVFNRPRSVDSSSAPKVVGERRRKLPGDISVATARRMACGMLTLLVLGIWAGDPLCAQSMLSDPLAARRFVNPAEREPIPETVVDIRIEGNETIPSATILQRVQTQPNRPVSEQQVQSDKRALMRTRWFFSVAERFERTAAGAVLVFEVHERPIVRTVQFIGNDKLKKKYLEAWTGLKPGSPFDHLANRQAVYRIEQEYKERGYYFIKVHLDKGGHPDDRDVVIRVEEGPLVRVTSRVFEGNRFWTDGDLKKHLVSKSSIVGLFGGIYRPEQLPQDIAAVKDAYQRVGYFDVEVTAEPLFSRDRKHVRLAFTVKEGPPYMLRDLKFDGNAAVPTQQLRALVTQQPGEQFNAHKLAKNVREMLEIYGDRGHLFARVTPVPRFSEQPGVVDVVFRIDEDRPRYLRDVTIEFDGDYPHTKETVIRDRMLVHPGDLAVRKYVDRSRTRLAGSGLFEPGMVFEPLPVETANPAPMVAESRILRGQDGPMRAEDEFAERMASNARLSAWSMFSENSSKHTDPGTPASVEDFRRSGHIDHRVARPAMSPMNGYRESTPGQVFRQSQEGFLSMESAGDQPVIRGQSPYPPPDPGGAVLEGSPFNNQFQPLPPGYVDLRIRAAEGRTGRFMLGAGVNSDAGVVGSLVWDETNFDLFRPPMTLEDIFEGRAWRGGGQRFRLEAAPGDVVSRYNLSWTDPYFLYTDYSLSVSGFYFNRFYPDWDEDRLGGRVALGRQFTPEWSGAAALRLEEVELTRPAFPTPAVLQEAVGTNFLSTVRVSATHDTRDSTILPGTGHFADFAYEQAFGDFNYPRFEVDGRQYFTLNERPDGSGKQVLTFAGNLGWSGDDTPVFERYFAGGFQSFRGYAFRGVSPQVGGVSIGGTWQALGSVEYRVPVTADDMVSLVAFSDFGTVETDVSLDNFRATVGFGFRVVVPAMGPVPLAFDFAFPVKSQSFDDERIFSFYVGFNR